MWEHPKESAAWILPSQFNVKNAEKFNPYWINHQLNSGLKHVVVSHEGLSTFSKSHWKQLRSCIPRSIEPRIIIVFRPWRDYLISRWSTCCMRRDSNSFHKYIDQLINSKIERVELDHSLCIKRPVSAKFNRLECIDYQANFLKDKSILPILCRRAGIPIEKRISHYNKRPKADRIDLLRIINGARSEMEGREQNELFKSLGEHRPVDTFYDQTILLNALKQRDQALITEILEKLNESKEPIYSLKIENLIREKQQDLHQAMAPWKVGEVLPTNDKTNASPSGVFSKLEYQDLSTGTKEKLKTAIRQASNV